MLFTAIPAYRWESIQKKARSLSKYGCTVKLIEVCQHEKGQVITIDITIPDHLEAGRWQFLGIKKAVNSGEVLYFGDIPAEFKNANMYCQHCNSRRYRKSVIIIADLETGKTMQVGKTCVKKYLRTGFSQFGDLLLSIDDLLEESGSDNEGGYNFFSKYIETRRYLYYCLQDMLKRGYIKKNTYDNRGAVIIPTSMQALNAYDKAQEELLELDYKDIEEAISIYKAFVVKQGESDFTHNVITLLDESYIERKYINYIAFVPSFLLNQRKFDAEKKAREEEKAKFNSLLNNEYLGQEKDKVACKARIIHLRMTETHFSYNGEFNITYTFITDKGQLIQWRTQKEIVDLDKSTNDIIAEKHWFNIAGTIKECKEFKGRFYTVLTRCKIK